jgi:hypothetical protein
MGNITEKVYITGEKDHRFIAFDKPFLYETNIAIRYPTIYDIKPELVVNYEQEPNIKWLYVSNLENSIIEDEDIFTLRRLDKTIIVLIECDHNRITGNFSNCKIIESKIAPIVKLYSLK